MTEKLKKLIEEETKKLPIEWQDAITFLDWGNISEEIGKKYLLNEVEINDLQIETGLVMVGLEDQESYALNIESNIGLSKNESIKIAEEMDQKIFTLIKQKLSSPSNFDIAENKIESEPISHSVDLQKAVESSDYKTKTYAIGQKYNLAIDQIGVLEEIISKAVVGNIHPDKLENEIKSKIQIPNDKINELIADLNEEIFKEIRNLLKTQNELLAKEDEVPLPPYKEIVKNIDPIASVNGIEILNEEMNKKIEPVVKEGDEDEIFKNSGIDIIEDKLNKMTVSDSTVSNYSLPRMSSVDKDPQVKDLYREEI